MKTAGAIRNLTTFFGPRYWRDDNEAALWLHIAPARSERLLFAGQRVDEKALRRMGVFLVVLSFVTPAWNFDGVGIGAFFLAPFAAGFALSYGIANQSWAGLLLGIAFAAAWLANGAVFFKLSQKFILLWGAIPWLLFFLLALSGPKGAADPAIVTFFPFYLWAIGLDLIHGSRWIEENAVNRLAQGIGRAGPAHRRAA